MNHVANWIAGVDLGGTRIEVAQVDAEGHVGKRLRHPTDRSGGPKQIQQDIVATVRRLWEQAGSPPVALGLGVAGQVDGATGAVRYAPNLDWHDVPLQSDLHASLEVPVTVVNDVFAATWGEGKYGAGRGCDDLVCVFIGTGIGGGIVSGGRVVTGSSNTAGELGHLIVQSESDRQCAAGHHGCWESLASGSAIAAHARVAIAARPNEGSGLLALAGHVPEAVSAETVAKAFHWGDLLALQLITEARRAWVAGAVSIVHALNPARLIFGGGVTEGLPELVDWIAAGVREQALSAATIRLQIVPAMLGNDAGVIGAAAIAQAMSQEGRPA